MEKEPYIPKLMNLKAVCREIGLPSTPDYVSKIRRLIHKHEVRHYKLGNEIALSMGQLIYLLRQLQSDVAPKVNNTGNPKLRRGYVRLADVIDDKLRKHGRDNY